MTQEEPIKSAIYSRVSPTRKIKEKSELHASIQESLRICRDDALYEGNIIVKEYIDEYVSGKSTKTMPDFNRMMKDAKKREFKRIYCRRVNRFGRNRADMLKAEIELSELGITIKFVENGIDTGKDFGKSIMALLSEMAEMDRKEILENTKRGREYAKDVKGVKFGRTKKVFDINSIRHLRLLPVGTRPTWEKLENDYKVRRSTMIQRLKEAGYWDYEKRCVK